MAPEVLAIGALAATTTVIFSVSALMECIGLSRVLFQAILGVLAGFIVIGLTGLSFGAASHFLEFAGEVGIFCLMFGVGNHLKASISHTANLSLPLKLSLIAVVVPALSILGLQVFWPGQDNSQYPFGSASWWVSSCFIAIAASATALPVLGDYLLRSGNIQSTAGRISLVSAAMADLFTWILIALLLTIGGNQNEVLALIFLVGFCLTCRLLTHSPVLLRLLRSSSLVKFALTLLVVLLGVVLNSSVVLCGLIAGIFIGSERTKLESRGAIDQVSSLLTTLYFVLLGSQVGANWKTDGESVDLTFVCAVVVVGILAKFASVLTAMWRATKVKSLSIEVAVFLNARGATEIVIAATGWSAGLLSSSAFIALLFLATCSTALLFCVKRGGSRDEDYAFLRSGLDKTELGERRLG